MDKKDFNELSETCAKQDYIVNPNFAINHMDTLRIICEHIYGKYNFMHLPKGEEEASKIVDKLIDYLYPMGYYFMDVGSSTQCNAIMVDDIIHRKVSFLGDFRLWLLKESRLMRIIIFD